MKVVQTQIPEVLLLEPKVFRDDRGFFFESYNSDVFAEAVGSDVRFVQDNHSRSSEGVLRGLHYQVPPFAQGKLIRVISGEIFDVAVDIREKSPTFGQWVGVYLSEENNRQIWIPEGFAHGFLVMSEEAEVLYKTNRHFSPAHERCIAWDDPGLQIEWPFTGTPDLSEKDKQGSSFEDAEFFG